MITLGVNAAFHDSAACLVRDGAVTRLTRDQTLAQLLVDLGRLSPEQAARDPRSHSLVSALGCEGGEVEPEVKLERLRPGDAILVCSDGLNKHVSDAQIAEVLTATQSPERAARHLVSLALDGGGSDNVTAIVGRCFARS